MTTAILGQCCRLCGREFTGRAPRYGVCKQTPECRKANKKLYRAAYREKNAEYMRGWKARHAKKCLNCDGRCSPYSDRCRSCAVAASRKPPSPKPPKRHCGRCEKTLNSANRSGCCKGCEWRRPERVERNKQLHRELYPIRRIIAGGCPRDQYFGERTSSWRGGRFDVCSDCGKPIGYVGPDRRAKYRFGVPLCRPCAGVRRRQQLVQVDCRVCGAFIARLKPADARRRTRCRNCFLDDIRQKNDANRKLLPKPECAICGRVTSVWSSLYCAQHKRAWEVLYERANWE